MSVQSPKRIGFALFLNASLFFPNQSTAASNWSFEVAFPQLKFQEPLDLRWEGRGKVFVAEKRGVVKVFDSKKPTQAEEYLNIIKQVDSSGYEMGLLSVALHPRFDHTGLFYVYYTAANPLRTVLSEFQTRQGKGDPHSERIILQILQPFQNHNGGQIAFGPDGLLYLGVGDGGSAGDPHGYAQKKNSWLGKILRVDVNRKKSSESYTIPKSNPFIGNKEGWKEEIFAFGLRNPWRISFDGKTGELWTGDVGQDRIEEVHVIEAGKNYGWNKMEGSDCYPPEAKCDSSGMEKPRYEYSHSAGHSITGGYVYRGKKFPALIGKYIYGDFVSGRVWAANEELVKTALNISSFGQLEDNEIYLTAFDGKIYRLNQNR